MQKSWIYIYFKDKSAWRWKAGRGGNRERKNNKKFISTTIIINFTNTKIR